MAECPTPSKKAYETRTAAMFFGRADGLRAYRCMCGRWHLSSKPRSGHRMGIARPRKSGGSSDGR